MSFSPVCNNVSSDRSLKGCMRLCDCFSFHSAITLSSCRMPCCSSFRSSCSVISIFKIVAQGFLLEWKIERSQTYPSKLPVIDSNIHLVMADLVETTTGAQRREWQILFRLTCRRNIRLLEQKFNSKANTRSKL